MSKSELIDQERGRLSDTDLDRPLELLRTLTEEHAESSLARDCLSPEADAVRADLSKASSSGVARFRSSARPNRVRCWCWRHRRETISFFARSRGRLARPVREVGSQGSLLLATGRTQNSVRALASSRRQVTRHPADPTPSP